jgi:hypothetical protein
MKRWFRRNPQFEEMHARLDAMRDQEWARIAEDLQVSGDEVVKVMKEIPWQAWGPILKLLQASGIAAGFIKQDIEMNKRG